METPKRKKGDPRSEHRTRIQRLEALLRPAPEHFDCSHLVEPLTIPILKLNRGIYIEVTCQIGVIKITTNTGERYQHFAVSRSAAVAFAKNPDNAELIKGRRLERVRGVILIEWMPQQ